MTPSSEIILYDFNFDNDINYLNYTVNRPYFLSFSIDAVNLTANKMNCEL
mgnify:CR=1 FL=1